jgi:hypothetical protein
MGHKPPAPFIHHLLALFVMMNEQDLLSQRDIKTRLRVAARP